MKASFIMVSTNNDVKLYAHSRLENLRPCGGSGGGSGDGNVGGGDIDGPPWQVGTGSAGLTAAADDRRHRLH